MKASSVQFSEPVQTRSPSTTTYLLCIRRPNSATGRTSSPSESTYSGGAGGRGTSRYLAGHVVVVVADAQPHAARSEALEGARDRGAALAHVEVVDRDGHVAPRALDERGELAGDRLDLLAAVVQEAQRERVAHERGAVDVAQSAASSGESVRRTSSRSSAEIMPGVCSCSRDQSSRPLQ